MPRYASSTDVARLAGVSQSSVSRTYRPGTSVSAETRKRVLAAAETLGYRPSMIPQIMVNHRSNLVALVIGGMYNPFYARVLDEFTVQLHATGHQVLLVHVDSDHSLDSVIPGLAGYRVDAIVSALAVLSPTAAEALARFKIPVVSFNTPVKNEWVSSISPDNERAGAEIADHFIARGAHSFGYLSGPAGSPASEDRLNGFRDRLAARGYDPPTVAAADFHYEGGRQAMLSLIRKNAAPEAIFCANDLLAMGAIDAISSRTTLSVPHDILVAGFDDIPMASWDAYALTTFVQDAALMVSETIRILQSPEDAQAPLGDIHIVLPARLVERRSTRGSPLRRRHVQ
jgi:DNA-binding LacI/PurR family transcriptional regulator